MAKVQAKTVKIKKKQWLPIYTPESFGRILLGESYVTDKQQLLKKSITTSLMVLTDDPRKQGYSLRFDVTSLHEGRAQTQAIGMSMTPSAIKRLIRRHRDKITDSIIVRIAGGRLIRVKPLLVTRTKASKSSQTRIRLLSREYLRDHFKRMRFDDIIHDIIEAKVQRQLKDIGSKIHPLRTADIKEIVILPEGRQLSKDMEELMEKEIAEEDARRQQMVSAAAAASVEDEPKPKARPKRKVPSKKKSEESAETKAEE